ncbi:MAG: cell envelope-related transcriptional attenuator [Candidatus Peribacteria bacterium]|nr:cell envelope-related transcriptional attenuator [Candidatus Peribacteria bacterium]
MRHRKEKAEHEKEAKRLSWLKRLFLILLAIFLSLFVLAGVAKALFSLNIINVKNIVQTIGSNLPVDANGFTNFLVLGQGDDSHQGVDLTDTMMIASVDTKTKSVVMVSIPRDLYFTKTAKMGTGRVNGLYRDYKNYLQHRQGMSKNDASQAAMKELATELGDTFGVQIHRVVKVDFIGFQQAVDAIGGIDIEVPQAIHDTTYPGENYSYTTFAIEAGPHHLDGETALQYARSRHSTSDFSRSARQQQIIAAIVTRAREKGVLTSPSTLTNLYKSISDNMETTMSLTELIGAAKLGMDIDRSRIITAQINDTNGQSTNASAPGGFLYTPPRENFGGAFVLLPVAYHGLETWGAVRTFISLLLHNRETYLMKPRVDVLNAGARSGLARALAGELLRNGFELNELRNAKIPDQETSSVIINTGSGALAASLLEKNLGLPTNDLPPPELDRTGLADVTILLGKDYQYQTIPGFLKIRSTGASNSGSDLSSSGSGL